MVNGKKYKFWSFISINSNQNEISTIDNGCS